MAYIQTIPEEQTTGKLREIYEADTKSGGYVTNYTKAMSLRPEVIEAWRNLLKSICSNLRLRRYELITFAAATTLKCTY